MISRASLDNHLMWRHHEVTAIQHAAERREPRAYLGLIDTLS